MKTTVYVLPLAMWIVVLGIVTGLSSCSDEYIRDHGNGKPAVIDYVRLCDPAKADSAIYEAEMLSTIAIVGTNLQSVNSIFFGR